MENKTEGLYVYKKSESLAMPKFLKKMLSEWYSSTWGTNTIYHLNGLKKSKTTITYIVLFIHRNLTL